MIDSIRELNFPSYATLSQATISLQDMAEGTITTQLKIDGQIAPDFSFDWEILYQGSKYIMPLRKPQSAKENTSLASKIDLTFQHWAVYQLKRWFFFTIPDLQADTVVADKYIASVSLNLTDFCNLYNKVLNYYYGPRISLDLNPDWEAKSESTPIEISHSYMWDVLIQLYDLYGVRWQIEPTPGPFEFDPDKWIVGHSFRESLDEGGAWEDSDYISPSYARYQDLIPASGSLHFKLPTNAKFSFMQFDADKKYLGYTSYSGTFHWHDGDDRTFDLDPRTRYIGVIVGDYYLNTATEASTKKVAPYIFVDSDNPAYVIKVGYDTTEISHIFEYGFEGGLLKVERQVQDDNIRNMIIGRGGSQNLPFRYFKKHDNNNISYTPDPDWIPELANITFTELRGATFRSYVQGWRAKHYPDDPDQPLTVTKAEDAYAPWAWMRGFTDDSFNPVEFVADQYDVNDDGYHVVDASSIAEYGELMGSLENNEEIFPTIQGVEIDGLGRIDEVVYIEPITSDDVEESSTANATLSQISDWSTCEKSEVFNASETKTVVIQGPKFTVPHGMKADLLVSARIISPYSSIDATVLSDTASLKVYNLNGEEFSPIAIPSGTYYFKLSVDVENHKTSSQTIRVGINAPQLSASDGTGVAWDNTWDVWIKNIWQTKKLSTETDEQYTSHVWDSILGSSNGDEARIAFSDGWLAISEEYEFTIVQDGVHYDTSKIIEHKDKDGNVIDSYPSHWRLTLSKSDVELDTSGFYVPSTRLKAKSGDHFYFLGIDMPHLYVTEAEKRLDDAKKDELNDIKDIKPTWVVGLDKLRINELDVVAPQSAEFSFLTSAGVPLSESAEGFTIEDTSLTSLTNLLRPGNTFTLFDQRFIPGSHQEKLYISSVTITYKEADTKSAVFYPDVEVVLSDKYTTSANPVSQLSSEVSAIQRQFGSISNIEQLIRQVGDTLYLRKDGFPDRSMSSTQFASLLSSVDFLAGILGGKGWGIYRDANGNSVIEADTINVRKEMFVNSLVINQIEARGGMIVESCASLEVLNTWSDDDGNFVCQFDTKDGSVANLFRVDDIAYCHRFNADNTDLKYYKRKVIDVDVDTITLSASISDGEGTPAVGDNIVQYGNYSDKRRQFVKVRDVMDGGYECYIENLNSVVAEGTEYYFVGKQSASGSYRFFLGDKNRDYIEWVDGKLSIKGDISISSSIGGSNSTIGSVVDKISIYYKQTDSPTTTPSLPTLNSDGSISNPNGWSTATIEREKGMYLWMVQYTRFVDGSGLLGQPVCTSGFDGEDGEPGINGEDAVLYEIRSNQPNIVRQSDGKINPKFVYIDVYKRVGESESEKLSWQTGDICAEFLDSTGNALYTVWMQANAGTGGSALQKNSSITALRFSYVTEKRNLESTVAQIIVPVVIDPVTYLSFFNNTSTEFESIKQRITDNEISTSEIKQTADNISLLVTETSGWKNYLVGAGSASGWSLGAGTSTSLVDGALQLNFNGANASTRSAISPLCFLTKGRYVVDFSYVNADADDSACVGIEFYNASGSRLASDTAYSDDPYRPDFSVTEDGYYYFNFSGDRELSICHISVIERDVYISSDWQSGVLKWKADGAGVAKTGISISKDMIVLDSKNTIVTGALSQFGFYIKQLTTLTDTNCTPYLDSNDRVDLLTLGCTYVDVSNLSKTMIIGQYWGDSDMEERAALRGLDGVKIYLYNNSSKQKGVTGAVGSIYNVYGTTGSWGEPQRLIEEEVNSNGQSIILSPYSTTILTGKLIFDYLYNTERFAFFVTADMLEDGTMLNEHSYPIDFS